MLYQLRNYYTVSTSDLTAVVRFMGEQLVPAATAIGFQHIGAFTTMYGPSPRLTMIFAFADVNDRMAKFDALETSDAWREIEPGLYPDSRPLIARYDTALLRLSPYSPDIMQSLNTATPGVYEERIYHGTSTRNHAKINARFANHTTHIFPKHGINAVGFWNVEIGENQPALYYLVRYDALGDRDAQWNGFRADPEWQSVVAESEKDGPIVRAIEAHILTPTAYSPLH